MPKNTPKKTKEKKPTDKLADKTALEKFLQGIFGDAQKKTLRRMYKKAMEITALEDKYKKLSKKESVPAYTDTDSCPLKSHILAIYLPIPS